MKRRALGNKLSEFGSKPSKGKTVNFRGIIFTGTSGAGKSTISSLLRSSDPLFEQVKAVTTRAPRPDDEPGSYLYLSDDEFDRISDSLVISAGYRDKRYGITSDHIAEVEGRGKVPVLVITAQSLAEYLERGGSTPPFLAVFVDASDEVLDARLAERGVGEWQKVETQRAHDRSYRGSTGQVLENLVLEDSLRQLRDWWRQGPTVF